jgi:prepilin-type N-terminal cleavage/methylation domain-containing protein
MYTKTKTTRYSIPNGFTLIEILIVVVILGLLAAMVIPQFRDASNDAAKTAFIANGRSFVQAAERMRMDTGEYPEDSGSNFLPDGFGNYIQENRWVGGTPIGGVWDAELNSFGLTSSLGVHFNGMGETRDDAFMQEIDLAIDDGDLTTGGFRKIAGDRYYFVIVD